MEVKYNKFYTEIEEEINNFIVGGVSMLFNNIMDLVLSNGDAPLDERATIPTVMINKNGYFVMSRYQYKNYDPLITPDYLKYKFRNVEYHGYRDKGLKKAELRDGKNEQFNADYRNFLIIFHEWYYDYISDGGE